MDKSKVPQFVSHVTETLQKEGFEAYLVGGCVRDILMDKEPKDWDLTTNAKPEEIQSVFSELKTVYENTYGTVTVVNMAKNESERVVSPDDAKAMPGKHVTSPEEVQVTTYRSEGGYSDNRHPEHVSYETNIEKDLERRDFTMNSIAWDPIKDIYIDPYKGQKDIKDKLVRCVLYPEIRFDEDALRIMRAVRFSTSLGFAIESETLSALTKKASSISNISSERVRDEFLKIIASDNPAFGISLLERTGLLAHIIPELRDGIGCEQKGAHIYDVFDHLLHALQHAADKGFSLEIRLAALFHDIGKPATRRYDTKKDKYTFFGHEVVGARMTKKILERLRVSRETTELVVSMVRNHMFFSDTEQITLSAVRRVIQKVKPDHIWELMQVRESDRVGMKKVEAPYRLRKYHAMIEEALRDPISVSQLAIDGTYLMDVLHMKPGPRMGWILHALLEEVLEDPKLNTIELLTEKVKELDNLEDKDLKVLGEKGKDKKEEVNEGEVKQLHAKHNVKK
ncbi:MAG: HD domain-containing protein [Candidatus Pacebacteria bacterium]|nr:HD domain-containing protein [Candidatus Paceibacterota bacterium]